MTAEGGVSPNVAGTGHNTTLKLDGTAIGTTQFCYAATASVTYPVGTTLPTTATEGWHTVTVTGNTGNNNNGSTWYLRFAYSTRG